MLYSIIQHGTVLPTHLYTETIHFFTTKSRRYYAAHPEDVQTAGSYLHEAGGSIHTFMTSTDATECAKGFMVVNGANVNLVDGEYHGMMDTNVIEDGILGAVKAGLVPRLRYIRPAGGAHFSVT